MRTALRISLSLACFLCSQDLKAAAYEDKREDRTTGGRHVVHSLPGEEQQEEVAAASMGSGKNISARAEGGASDEGSAPSQIKGKNPFAPSELARGVLKLSLNPLPLDLMADLRRVASSIQILTIEDTTFDAGTTVPFTDSVPQFSALKRFEVKRSTLTDDMLFFLGLRLPKLSNLKEIVLEANNVFTVGIKAFFLGMLEMPQLERFSWKGMPLGGPTIPWQTKNIMKTEGYLQSEHEVEENGVVETRLYIHKTPWRFLLEDLLPRLVQLKHLDVGSSLKVAAEDKPARDELMELLSLVPSIVKLENLGLSYINFDEFSVRALSRALIRLAEAQMLKSGDVLPPQLRVLDLEGTLQDSEQLKSLAHGLGASRYLRELNLAHNHIGPSGGSILKEFIHHLNRLKILNLSGNDLFVDGPAQGQHVIRLGQALATRVESLEELGLSQNGMADRDLFSLKDTLFKMQTLKVLDLSANGLTNKSVATLKECMLQMKKLQKIIVSGNEIGSEKLAELKILGDSLKIDVVTQ